MDTQGEPSSTNQTPGSNKLLDQQGWILIILIK